MTEQQIQPTLVAAAINAALSVTPERIIVFACDRCAATTVTREADVAWNVAGQCWEIVGDPDNRGYCPACGADGGITDVCLDDADEIRAFLRDVYENDADADKIDFATWALDLQRDHGEDETPPPVLTFIARLAVLEGAAAQVAKAHAPADVAQIRNALANAEEELGRLDPEGEINVADLIVDIQNAFGEVSKWVDETDALYTRVARLEHCNNEQRASLEAVPALVIAAREAESLAVLGDITEETAAFGWGAWLKAIRAALVPFARVEDVRP